MNKRDTKLFLLRLSEPYLNNKKMSDKQVYQQVLELTSLLVKTGDIDEQTNETFLRFLRGDGKSYDISKAETSPAKASDHDPCSRSTRSPC